MTEKSINRLILLGNGFDLAHQLKTSYNDFIKWYLIQAMELAKFHREYVDELMTIIYPEYYAMDYLNTHGLDKVLAYVNYFYEKGFLGMISGGDLKFPGWQNNYTNPFKFNIHSDLLDTLLFNCSHANWVDIENTFYEQLKQILRHKNRQEKEKGIAELNNSLKIIIQKLEEYLSSLDVSANKADYESIINSPFEANEFVGLTTQEE